MNPLQRKAAALAVAISLAGPAEGLRQWAYRDPVGILTVCEGHTGPDVDPTRKYSLAECKALMTADMIKAIDQVERCAPGLPPHQLAAFADTVFNAGPTVACNTAKSTAARLLAEGRVEDACRQLPRWDKARVAGVAVTLPGLTKRRAKASQLCLTGVLA